MKHKQQLISEQLPNDGGAYLLVELNKAQKRLGELGKRKKRCQIKKTGDNLSFQFHFEKQQTKGTGCRYTLEGIAEAEKLAALITGQLMANQFTWDWFNRLMGKPVEQPEGVKQLTCDEMLKQYKAHFFAQRKNAKTPKATWCQANGSMEKVLLNNSAIFGRKIIERIT